MTRRERQRAYLPGLGFVEDENNPSPSTLLHRAQNVEANAIARNLSDAQAKAMERATTYGAKRYSQNKRTMLALYNLQLVGEPFLVNGREVRVATALGLRVIRQLVLGARKSEGTP